MIALCSLYKMSQTWRHPSSVCFLFSHFLYNVFSVIFLVQCILVTKNVAYQMIIKPKSMNQVTYAWLNQWDWRIIAKKVFIFEGQWAQSSDCHDLVVLRRCLRCLASSQNKFKIAVSVFCKIILWLFDCVTLSLKFYFFL